MSSTFAEYPGWVEGPRGKNNDAATGKPRGAGGKRGRKKKNKDERKRGKTGGGGGKNRKDGGDADVGGGEETAASETTTLTTTAAPQVPVFAASGQIVRFPCEIDSLPTARIEWELNRKPLPQDDRYIILPSGTLQILEVSPSDAGNYSGDDDFFLGFAMGLGLYTPTLGTSGSADGGGGQPFLHLSHLVATIWCVARNEALRRDVTSPEGVLTVADTPDAASGISYSTPEEVTVLEGEAVVFEYVPQGTSVPVVPPADSRWRRLDNDLSPSATTVGHPGNMIIPRASRSDAGDYAYDNSIRVNVRVLHAPTILRRPQSVVAKSAGLVRLNCSDEANPPADVTWFRDGVPLSSGGRMQVKSGQLIVRGLAQTDAGVYQCMAMNEVGSVVAAANLTVEAPSVLLDPPSNLRAWESPENPKTTALLTWDRPAGELIAFTVDVFVGNPKLSHNKNNLVSGNETWTIIEGLDPNEEYNFTVRAYQSRSSSEPAPHVSWAAGKNPSIQPTFTVKQFNATAVLVEWNEFLSESVGSGEIKKYKVEWWIKSQSDSKLYASDIEVPANKRSQIISGLFPGSEYEFRVLAAGDSGYPAYMLELFRPKRISLPRSVVDRPSSSALHLLLEKLNSTTARASWTLIDKALVGSVSKYKIEVKSKTRQNVTTAAIPGTENTYVLHNLDPIGRYDVMLTPIMRLGMEANAVTVSQALNMDYRLVPPAEVLVTSLTPVSIKLRWNAVPEAEKYNLSIREILKDNSVGRIGHLDAEQNEADLVQLMPDTEYMICIRSVDRNGKSTDCSHPPITARTKQIGPPLNVTWTPMKNAVRLMWNPPDSLPAEDDVTYEILYYHDMMPSTAVFMRQDTKYRYGDLTDLTRGRKYNVHVRVKSLGKSDVGGVMSNPPLTFTFDNGVDSGIDAPAPVTGQPEDEPKQVVEGNLDETRSVPVYVVGIMTAMAFSFVVLTLISVAYIYVIRRRRDAGMNGMFGQYPDNSGPGRRRRRRWWPGGGGGGGSNGPRTVNGGGHGPAGDATPGATGGLFLGNGNGSIGSYLNSDPRPNGGRYRGDADVTELSALTPMLPRTGETTGMAVMHNFHEFKEEGDHRFEPRRGSAAATECCCKCSCHVLHAQKPSGKPRPLLPQAVIVESSEDDVVGGVVAVQSGVSGAVADSLAAACSEPLLAAAGGSNNSATAGGSGAGSGVVSAVAGAPTGSTTSTTSSSCSSGYDSTKKTDPKQSKIKENFHVSETRTEKL
ncbi:unnamed protein product [Notodromas monacha]|uniref:Uncharacterized protein n=1 Tax=Notodromas monacha TaxID=399045 RepID=A0A7R9GFC1_9CRUS|nr:unnamed protein product [Notodromas monacha]CAG0920637.1 unnamed protein product [Notodromas monacha]